MSGTVAAAAPQDTYGSALAAPAASYSVPGGAIFAGITHGPSYGAPMSALGGSASLAPPVVMPAVHVGASQPMGMPGLKPPTSIPLGNPMASATMVAPQAAPRSFSATMVAPPVIHRMAPQPVVHTMAQPVVHYAPPVQMPPVVMQSIRAPEYQPHPDIPEAVISQTAHPPQRLGHKEEGLISYVGDRDGNAHLITHQSNFQPTHKLPETDFHHVKMFREQRDLIDEGAHTFQTGHPGGHFGPKQPAHTAHAYTASGLQTAAQMYPGHVSQAQMNAVMHLPPGATFGSAGAAIPMGSQLNTLANSN